MIFFHGTSDSTVSIDKARGAVKDLKSKGHLAQLIEEKGLTHDYTISVAPRNQVYTRNLK